MLLNEVIGTLSSSFTGPIEYRMLLMFNRKEREFILAFVIDSGIYVILQTIGVKYIKHHAELVVSIVCLLNIFPSSKSFTEMGASHAKIASLHHSFKACFHSGG